MFWLPVLLISLVAALIIYVATGFLNEWLGRKRNWVDRIAIMALPLAVFISPMFMEYKGNLNDYSSRSSKVVSFDSVGNVVDSSNNLVWCVTNNCANAPWHEKVTFDESVIVGNKVAHFVIVGEAEVTDYHHFLAIPGIQKPTGWWDTPGAHKNAEVLTKTVKEQLCWLITYHARELMQTPSINKEDSTTLLQVLIERYLAPKLDEIGVTFKALKFEVKKGCDCPQPAEAFGPPHF